MGNWEAQETTKGNTAYPPVVRRSMPQDVIILLPVICLARVEYYARMCGTLQMFDGTDGKPRYPKRWVVFPPIL